MARKNKLLYGAAAAGTLLGSLALALYPRRNQILKAIGAKPDTFAERAREFIDERRRQLPSLKKESSAGYLATALLGLVTGAGSALLLSPRGKAIRSRLTKTYQNISTKPESIIQFIQRNSEGHRKGLQRPAKRKKKIQITVP